MKTYTIPNKDIDVYEFDLTSELDFDKILVDAEKFRLYEKSNNSHSKIHGVYLSSWLIQTKTNVFDSIIKSTENKMNSIADIIQPANQIPVKYKVLEAWLLFYNKLGYSEYHNHVHYAWASVCYISAKKTSSIFFNDFEFKPSTGKLLIFPGMLRHKVGTVLPSHSDRIVMATNLFPFIDYSDFLQEHKINIDL